jgi:hypothetical protein
MAINNSKLLSGRVPVTPYSNLTSDRYQFLGLEQAEPSLGAGANNSVLTISTSNTRVWSNTLSLSSLTVTGESNLGNISNVHIFGGTSGQVIQTDGAGNLIFADTATGNSAAPMPFVIPVGESYTVPNNFQGLFTVPITIDGTFEIDGILAEVGTAINSLNSQIIFDDNGELTGNAGFTFDTVSGNLAVPGNATVAAILTNNYYYANGQPLDVGGNPGGSNTYVQFNSNGEFGGTANLTFDSATNNLAVTGNISTTNLAVTGNAVVTGNLYVDGNLIYINVEELSVQDPIITLNTGPNGVPPVANTGKDVGTALFYYDTQARTAFMGWDTSNSEFAFGSQTSISSEVVTFTTLGNVRAQTFSGNIVATTISGNLTTASQSNITTVGTLGSLSVTGNVDSGAINTGNVIGTGTITGNYLVSNSGCVTIGGATIAVTGNNAGIFASLVDDINLGLASNIVMGGSALTVTVQGNLISNVNITAIGNVSGNLLTGTLTTNSQPNVTSVGTLGNLSVTGTVTSGNITVTNTIDAVNIKVTDLFSKRTSINISANTVIDTFPTAEFRSAKYTMRAGDGTDYQALEVLLVHNNINSIITVYGSLSTSNTDLVLFTTDISAGNVNVYATAVGANTNLNLMGTYVPD